MIYIFIHGSNEVLVITNREMKNLTHGEDVYLKEIINVLREYGLSVKISLSNEQHPLLGNPSVCILHNVSYFLYGRQLKKTKCRIIAPIYFLWNNESNIGRNLISTIGKVYSQNYIDKYIVTSKFLMRKSEIIGIKKKKLHLIEPFYNCTYCDKISVEKFEDLNSEVRIVYIGSISPNRIPLKVVLKELYKVSKKGIKILFQVYSTRFANGEPIFNIYEYQKNNLKFKLIPRFLSDHDKHKILSKSHFFLFVPQKKVTMEPSISLIEAVRHMAIPIVSKKLPGYEYLPSINIVDNLNQVSTKILILRNLLLENRYAFDILLKNFSTFFNKERFKSQIYELFEKYE